MTPEKIKRERILAVLTVFFLFIFVGCFLGYTSYNNKRINDELKIKAQRLETERLAAETFKNIHFDTASSSELTSRAYLTLAVNRSGAKKILTEKNPDLPLPIASITKLMVAIITVENVSLDTPVTATLDYIGQEESAFILETDKIYTVRSLLANMLVSSDNDSARLLGSTLGSANFIAKMNAKAGELGLTQTSFANITGLDPVKPSANLNISSATDLSELLIYLKGKYPEILRITTQAQYNFCDINNFCKPVISTDKFLADKGLRLQILGGKTGSTDLAGKNLALQLKYSNDMTLISIVLGAKDSFADTALIINHIRAEK